METAERSWHVKQASKLAKDTGSYIEAQRRLSISFWEVGQRLNKVYGFTEGSGSAPGYISDYDYEALEEIYAQSKITLQATRRFHRMYQTVADRDAALSINPLWRQHVSGNVNGEPKPGAVAVPTGLWAALAEQFDSTVTARDAIRWYVQNKVTAAQVFKAYEKFQTARGELLSQ